MADKQNILLLFEKPTEPLFTTKDDGKAVFDVPEEFFTDRYKTIGSEIQNRVGGDVERRIPLRNVKKPDLSFTNPIPKKGAFSLFQKRHQEIAGRLVKLFMDQPNPTDFMATAAFCKDRLNPYLFQYALSVSVQHRPDTRDLNIPSVVETFPEQFIDPSVFPAAREEASLVPQGNRMKIEIPPNFTATEKEEEQRLFYFREDIGVNMHHWHWHLVYPGEGPANIVGKDRRGELFYYMHSQIIARYNTERFANRLQRVRPLSNFREAIPEGYFPKIIRSANNRAYPPRGSNVSLSDVDRDNTSVEIGDMERWRDRILQAIDQKFVINESGQNIPLDETRGIDILGDIIESSALTPNRQLYGNLHNEGHNVISYSHDPQNRYLEDYGVIGDVTTAMRDPAFFRWHAFIDSIFVKHKMSLPAYTSRQLGFEGVTVSAINVQITKGNKPTPNVLLTFWQKSDVDIAAGLDFGPQGNVFASFTHLQHAPFTWRITVNNTGNTRQGTCRIFICPKNDERGMPLRFRDQRQLMVEMDKFTVTLNKGANTIMRRSDQSSVTIPYEQTFRRVGASDQPTGADELARFRFCGCGWPQHMLLPKGTAEGMAFNVFVMISNFADDTVNQDYDPLVNCDDAHSFCGLRDKLYPDKRAMGFPFDRNSTVNTVQDFANQSSNMGMSECQIRFTDTLVNQA